MVHESALPRIVHIPVDQRGPAEDVARRAGGSVDQRERRAGAAVCRRGNARPLLFDGAWRHRDGLA